MPLPINGISRTFAQDVSMEDENTDTSLESMSLLQYGDKQVYLFGIVHDGHNVNMKNMISDFQPDHILFGFCEERADKLLEVINKGISKNSGNSASSYFPPFSCESYINADPEAKTRHAWKSTSLSKAVISQSGLIYGKEYFDTLIEGQNKNITFIFGDLPIQPTIDSIEEFMNMIENEAAALEAKKMKLQKKAEATIGVRPTGRQKASKSFYTRAQATTRKEMAKLDANVEISLDNVTDVFVDKEFMSHKYPQLFNKVYDERDDNMFKCIQQCQGDVIFAVVPDLHIEGITNRLVEDEAMVLM